MSFTACDKSDKADQVGWSVGIVKENKKTKEQFMQSWGLGNLITTSTTNGWITGDSYLFNFKISFDEQDPNNADYTLAHLSNTQPLPPVVAATTTASNGLVGRVGERTIQSITPITQIDQTLFVETVPTAPEFEDISYKLFFNMDSIEVTEQDTTYFLYLLSEKINETPLPEVRKHSIRQALKLTPLTEQVKLSGSLQDSIDCKLHYIKEITQEKDGPVVYGISTVSKLFRIPVSIPE
jgi:hypothetical protein